MEKNYNELYCVISGSLCEFTQFTQTVNSLQDFPGLTTPAVRQLDGTGQSTNPNPNRSGADPHLV